MTGAEYHSIKSTPLCLFYTLFYFNITISLFWVRNINVSNCLPELSLLFHVYVRYYSPNFNKLLSFSFLKRVVVEKSSFEMTDLGLSSGHLFDSVILAKLLTWLLSLNVLICKVRIVIVPFWWSLRKVFVFLHRILLFSKVIPKEKSWRDVSSMKRAEYIMLTWTRPCNTFILWKDQNKKIKVKFITGL